MMSFQQVVRFTNDAVGLEKLLRLLQALSQILAAYALNAEDSKIWLHLRQQFALGRRYFRFFKFLECFSKAFACIYDYSGVEAILAVGKWSCMGGFLFLESVTILDAMGVWTSAWTTTCMIEANKLWFYSLVFSVLWGLLQLFFPGFGKQVSPESSGVSTEKVDGKAAPMVGRKQHDGVKRRLASDCFDLFIPGHVTGWISTSMATVGYATLMSTVLSSKDIWDKLQ